MVAQISIQLEKHETGYVARLVNSLEPELHASSLDDLLPQLEHTIKQHFYQSETQDSSVDKSVWELAEDFVKDVPEAVLNTLPTDGAEQHDHYIYGTPKHPT